MKRFLLMCVVAAMCTAGFAKENDEESNSSQDRISAAAAVLNEIQGTPDRGIPDDVLGAAECVAVVPSMFKGGFIVGARFGRGVASCRLAKGWSSPAFFSIQGGSFGFQVGGAGG